MDLSAAILRRARGPDDMAAVRRLFRAYLAELGVDLGFQGIEEELSDLPGPYREPGGAIVLAGSAGEPVGVAALKPVPHLGEAVAELKRLYVAPPARGSGLAEKLCLAVEEAARTRGYRLLKLDTLARLKTANALYRRLGYTRCAAYNDNPYDDILYFEKAL